MKALKLVLKYKWYDMIESGHKKEEYREIKGSIVSLLFNWKQSAFTRARFVEELQLGNNCLWRYLKDFDSVEFYRGYSSDRKSMIIKLESVNIGICKPELSEGWQGNVFIIKLGETLQ